MEDSTPDVKSKKSSKYLTPCRTFGLKRKTTPKSDTIKKVKSENNLSQLTPKSTNISRLSRRVLKQPNLNVSNFNNLSENQNTPVKTRIPVKRETFTTPQKQNTTEETQLIIQIKRINEKFNKLEQLKQEEIYTKKHNLLELQKSTDKWLSGLKEVTIALHSELQTRGKVCTILDVLNDHNISPERVGFNVDTLEFDS